MAFFKDLSKLIIPVALRRNLREYQVARTIVHLHGPVRISLAPDEAAVTCVIKNGEFYIEQFIEHYFQMGFRHVFFLDNGSTDRTIALAKQHDRVSVCHSSLPIQANQGLFKRYLSERYIDGGWCLDADVDEFFDYPFSDVIALRQFLEYLNGRQATAVVTQLLDMFSAERLSDLATQEQRPFQETYQYYDLSEITRVPYHQSDMTASFARHNAPTNIDTALQFGGIRKTLYGNNCLLTKHSLFRSNKGLDLFEHIHFVDKAMLADVSGIMRHYKLTSNALETAIQNRAGFTALTDGYDAFIKFLNNKKDVKIARTTAVKFQSVDELIPQGFVFVSSEYREYVKSKQDRNLISQGASCN
jgi:hypothetical protein